MDTFPARRLLGRAGAFFVSAALLYGLVVGCMGFTTGPQLHNRQAPISFLSHVHVLSDDGAGVVEDGRAATLPRVAGSSEFSTRDAGMGQKSLTQCPFVDLPLDLLAQDQDPLAWNAREKGYDARAWFVMLPTQPPRL